LNTLGCRTVVTREVPEYISFFELIADLNAAEEVDIKTLFIGHRAGRGTKEGDLQTQLKSIQHALEGRKLSNLIVNLHDDINGSSFSPYTDSIGIEIPSRDILQINQTKLLERIATISSSCEYFYVPVNAITLPHILPIISYLKQHNKHVIATDIYAAHESKPSLFISHSTASAVPVEEAISRLHKVLNTCIKLENAYLQKVTTISLLLVHRLYIYSHYVLVFSSIDSVL
jgi:hypothetical protein